MEDPMISGLRQVTDMQDMETQASPSLLSIRQSDLKIIIDDFPEDQMKPNASIKMQGNIQYIAKMVEKIKSLTKKKKVNGNISEYYTCHSCRGLLERNLLICCSDPECQRYFCFRCLNKKFNKSPEEIYEISTLSNWNCVACKGLCHCKICKARFFGKDQEFPVELTRFEKSKKKQIDFPIKVETDNESDLNAVKKEFIDEESPIQIQTITSPLLSFPLDKRISPKQEEEETLHFQIYPTSKPRSKALAKKILRQKRLGNHESESSSEDDSIRTPKSLSVNENSNRSISNKTPFVKGGKSRNKGECHMCSSLLLVSDLALCSIENCKKWFCLNCIRQNYQKDFDLRNYNPECWVCYSCGGACECLKCKRRRGTGRRNPDVIKAQEELMALRADKKASKLLEKRRIKFYDTLSEDDEEAESFRVSMEETIEENREVFPVQKAPRAFKGGRPRKQVKPNIENSPGKEVVVTVPKTTKKKLTKKEMMLQEKTQKAMEEEEEKVKEKEEKNEKEEMLIENDLEEAEEESSKEESVNKYILKKKRLRKHPAIDKEDIDGSKIIDEVSIDCACITLYDAENEEELKKEVQMKFEG